MTEEPLSDVECREKALTGVRTSLAAAQSLPVGGLDVEKSETVQDVVDDLRSLERELTNELSQMKGDGGQDDA